ncbi:hypothetical protein F4553_001406 [Allocatelliglobosispora scoriae]|uniref:CBM2 domain-containing protein n=1 Tax=Allocatelliglobosispora scoriae TaxID=643052 RepID=A0A841BG12_9ACTN|nr:cellulose binding domain-containing protein [Allocatelliglobosispora scoriae]MBB5868027.1 hypothetical protein [Allocatelliglobosispora scoriae]
MLLALLAACASALLIQLTTSALALPDPVTPVTGNSTYFDGLGQPYGGCGIPQAYLDSQDFVALNVFNTPGDYAYSTRPVPASQSSRTGMWENGLNCGRWVQVSIGDFCTGTNDGAPGQAFCRNGAWTADAYNGGTLTMLVADSCGDANAWCRDDPYHLDLSKPSLNRFVKNGSALTDLYPNHFNNRHLSWKFVPAPGYTGDINIGFLQGAQRYWPAISVSHLANGIHGVEYQVGGVWQTAAMNGDMGQSYIIGGTVAGGTSFQIRVRDVTGALINGGRTYSFGLPASCGTQCGAAYTPVAYTTGGTYSMSPSPASPSPSRSASASPSASVSPSASGSPSPSAPTGACSATYRITSSWPGYFGAEVTVKAGSAPINGWTVKWTYANGQTITTLWSGVLTSSGSAVTVKNVDYNRVLTANASAVFGFQASTGATNTVPVLTCTSP